MAGATICECTARRWNGGRTTCPHCGRVDEDVEHRMWQCPRWDAVRREAVPGLDLAALRRRLPDGQARTGLRTMDPLLLALAQVAQGVDPELPRQGAAAGADAGIVYSDGACYDPQDPLMARAAWAIHVPGEGGGVWAGPVQGAQTAQRGELMAAVAATVAMPQDFLL
eukprot:4240422-Lingulodinium_polyedra.AAC.1